MRFFPIVLAAVAVVASPLASGCGGKTEQATSAGDSAVDSGTTDSPIDATPPAAGQKLLFEAGYVNGAWGYTYSGVYVNAAGEVWSYSAPQANPPPTTQPTPHAGMTEAEITAKYASKPKLLTTLPTGEALQMYALLSLAESGMLLRQSLCADAGDTTYVGWRYDAATALYAPVVLGMSGDTSARSTAPAAGQVVAWLQKVGAMSADFCAPPAPLACSGSGCKPATCAQSWQVPACDGTCVSPAQCDAVASCAACSNGTSCLVDAAGQTHCSVVWGCSSGATSCDCAGDQICAGGKAWCRGDAITGFRCERP